MKKALLFLVSISIALCLGAYDGIDYTISPAKKTQSDQLLAQNSSRYPCLAYAIGRCNVRSEPTTNSSIVFEIVNNEQVQVVNRQGDFYYINAKGWHGWTHVSNLRLEKSGNSNTNNSRYPCLGYAKGRCNVRSAASTKSKIVYEIFDDEEVEVNGRKGDFYYIFSPAYGPGWTHVSNLRLGRKL